MITVDYISSGITKDIVDVVQLDRKQKDLKSKKDQLCLDILKYDVEIDALKDLKLRPDNCKIDSCPFIKNAVDILKHDPEGCKARAVSELESINLLLQQVSEELDWNLEYNACISQFNILIRDIDRNLIKTKEEVDWANLKPLLSSDDNGNVIYKKTGELIDMLETKETLPYIEIKTE